MKSEKICLGCGIEKVFCKNKCRKCYSKEYNQNPINKERNKKIAKIYTDNNKERIKSYSKEYRKRPDVINQYKKYIETEKFKKYQKEYAQRVDVKLRRKKNRQRPEAKEKIRKYLQRPEIKQKIKEQAKKYREIPEIKEKYKKYKKEYNIVYNQKTEAKEKKRISTKKWENNNKEYIAKKCKEKRKNDPIYYISCICRSYIKVHLNGLLKNKGLKRQERTIELIGCSFKFYKENLESMFDNKMTWENKGTYWEVHHIKEVSRFNLEIKEERLKAFHYRNVVPVTIEKHKKLTAEFLSNKAKEKRKRCI